MKTFIVKYMETYESEYSVNADNYEEAEAKLFHAIVNGKVDGPDQCVDSGCELKGVASVLYKDDEADIE